MSIEFSQLVEIYRNTEFGADGSLGTLTIPSQVVATLLQTISSDDKTARESGILILDDAPDLTIGKPLHIKVDTPRLGLGLFVRTLDDLLNAPNARLREPTHYYVLEGGLTRDTAAPPQKLVSYRAALAVISRFAEASSYVDETRGELIFIEDGKFVIPTQYTCRILTRLSMRAAQELSDQFADATHKEQKLEILARAIVSISRTRPPNKRLEYLLENLSSVVTAVRDGYRLFASNFSYSKIRSEIETAKLEYVTKIHKTVVDIQGQLLGIPVATVVVASQLKVADKCGVELWTNIAIIGGAWIFVVLLLIAVMNQWLTLGVIKEEIDRQKAKLIGDYAEIAGQFTDVFGTLGKRICWHRFGLFTIAIIAIIGAAFATIAFRQLVTVDIRGCLGV